MVSLSPVHVFLELNLLILVFLEERLVRFSRNQLCDRIRCRQVDL